MGTGKEQKMTITASTKLSEKDVENMVNQAEQYEEDDRKRKEEVEVRNTADSLIYTAEKTLSELSDKLSAEQKEKVNSAITSLKAAIEEKDTEKIKSETGHLRDALSEAGSAVYQQTAQEQAQAAGPETGYTGSEGTAAEGKGEEDVVDADFEVHEAR